MKRALVTGAAGFIGFHTAQRYLTEGWAVTGIDAVTDYYDPALKEARLAILSQSPNFTFIKDKIEAPEVLSGIFANDRPDHVIHLAAQAGVRHSIDAPRSYVDSNLLGTFELLEAARAHPGAKLLLASTSSVYGANTDMPYRETDKADTQMSFYAATKKATEAMAHSYAHLYDIPTTMFRFFTVYGPWGRPDMALFKFTKAILADQPIDVYNHGKMRRDFTYIDDLVEAIWRLANVPLSRPDNVSDIADFDSLSPVAPYRVVNIGKSQTDTLAEFIQAIENSLGKKAVKNLMAMQPGDVPATWAQTALLQDLTGYQPATKLHHGVPEFVKWYRHYYDV